MKQNDQTMPINEGRNIGARFAELLRFKSLTVSAFVMEIGGTTAKYYRLIHGKSKPDFETIVAVLDKFPEISAEWFMRGIGPILKQERLSFEESERILSESRVIKNLYLEELKRSAS